MIWRRNGKNQSENDFLSPKRTAQKEFLSKACSYQRILIYGDKNDNEEKLNIPLDIILKNELR